MQIGIRKATSRCAAINSRPGSADEWWCAQPRQSRNFRQTEQGRRQKPHSSPFSPTLTALTFLDRAASPRVRRLGQTLRRRRRSEPPGATLPSRACRARRRRCRTCRSIHCTVRKAVTPRLPVGALGRGQRLELSSMAYRSRRSSHRRGPLPARREPVIGSGAETSRRRRAAMTPHPRLRHATAETIKSRGRAARRLDVADAAKTRNRPFRRPFADRQG